MKIQIDKKKKYRYGDKLLSKYSGIPTKKNIT